MPKLIRLLNGAFVWEDDAFIDVLDEDAIPAGDVIVSLKRFMAEGEQLLGGRAVGVRLESDQAVEDLAYDLPRIAVTALVFPKYRDGRAYTSARLLRERYGFTGQIRAVGDVLLDRAQFLVRCGFDAFVPADGSDPATWAAATRRYRHVYQRAADHRTPAFVERAEGMSMAFDQVSHPKEVRKGPVRAPDHAMVDVRALDARLRGAEPQEILRAAFDLYGDKLALVSSFGGESAVLLHMAAQINPDVPVLFLDTGMLFGQTLDYRQDAGGEARPDPCARPQARLPGRGGARSRPGPVEDQHRRLLQHPQGAAARPGAFRVRRLITGRKRFHGGDRLRLKVVELADGKVKFNPLANWGKAELDAYAAAHDLPAHPLVEFGYPSVGCWPCTKPAEAEDVRSGRWAGSEKTECGIHTPRAASAAVEVGGDI